MSSTFAVHVVPRSRAPGPAGRHGPIPRLRVRAAPTDGRANAEVEKVLTQLMGCPVEVVSGHASRRKICRADLDPERLLACLSDIFDSP